MNKEEGLKGPVAVAKKLQGWQRMESPDLIDATIQYIVQEWLTDRKASIAAVYSVFLKFRNRGAKGDFEAAMLACELGKLLEQHGSLELRFRTSPVLMRRRTDFVGYVPH